MVFFSVGGVIYIGLYRGEYRGIYRGILGLYIERYMGGWIQRSMGAIYRGAIPPPQPLAG